MRNTLRCDEQVLGFHPNRSQKICDLHRAANFCCDGLFWISPSISGSRGRQSGRVGGLRVALNDLVKLNVCVIMPLCKKRGKMWLYSQRNVHRGYAGGVRFFSVCHWHIWAWPQSTYRLGPNVLCSGPRWDIVVFLISVLHHQVLFAVSNARHQRFTRYRLLLVYFLQVCNFTKPYEMGLELLSVPRGCKKVVGWFRCSSSKVTDIVCASGLRLRLRWVCNPQSRASYSYHDARPWNKVPRGLVRVGAAS